uniref:Uncharacterized protein n=1 Tax=Panagrolaimus superbus TaxID=310955 RepID=A0A914YGN7_9BILA
MAKICINDNGEEYLTVSDKQHICEPIKYNPDIYETAPKIVKKPFFDFVKRRTKGSRIVEKLVLFDETDPSMCFEYKKYNAHYFCCYNCFKKDKNYCVSAKLIKDEKNGDYLELKQKEHICGLRKFIPEDLNSNIVFSDGFKTDEYRASDGDVKQRLIVFHPQDHTLCHIYHNIGNRGQDYWLCSGM